LLAAALMIAPLGAAAAGFGTDGADFLRMPAGSRPAALGGAYDALATDAYAPAFNPAGLAFSTASLSATHVPYLDQVSYDALSASLPGGFGVSVQYLSPGKVAGTNAAGASIGDFGGHYAAAGAAYGRRIAPGLSLGLGAKFVHAAIDDAKASAFAGDLGALYRPTGRLALSAVVANLGSGLKFADRSDPLPRQYRLGAALSPAPSLTFAGRLLHESGGPAFDAGAEWRALEALAVRAGYATEASRGLTEAAGLTLGFGLRWKRLGFDYAFAPMGALGSISFFSLVLTGGSVL
jgi:hypothetical protein